MIDEIEAPAILRSVIDVEGTQGRLWFLGWTGEEGDTTVLGLRTTESEMEVEPEVDAGLLPSAVTIGFGAAWVTNGLGAGVAYSHRQEGPGFPEEHALLRVSPEGETEMIEVENPIDVAVAGESVWVLGRSGQSVVSRVDPATMEIVSTVKVDTAVQLVASDDGLWVLGSPADVPNGAEIRSIDPRTGELGPDSVLLPRVAYASASADAIALAPVGRDPKVTVLDDPLAAEPRTLDVPPGVDFIKDIVLVGARLWVVSEPRRIDVLEISTGEWIATGRVGTKVTDLTAFADSVWAIGNERAYELALRPPD